METKSKIIVGLFSLEQHLDVYYKTVEDHLECPTWVRKKYMELLKNDIADFLEMNPDATMDDVCTAFGDPFDQHNELLRRIEKEYMNRLRRRLIVCYGIIGCLTIILIVLVVFLSHFLSNQSRIVNFSNIYNVSKA